MPKILVIDDDRAVLLLVQQALSDVAEIVTAETAAEGIERLAAGNYDAILLDIVLPDRNGLAVFFEIHELDRRLPVIFMTVEATSGTAIEAMQMGAFDYLAKPLEMKRLRSLVDRAIQQRELANVPVAIAADELPASRQGEIFVGRSRPMLEVFKTIGRVSQQQVPVLIRGESGTGKELVARAIYQYSNRRDEPFLAVNCAALPENLLESELFGHEQGAFTGATARRIGKFEQASGGTLLLDEIGDMSPMVQAKVLRVLQEQRFERVGGNNELQTDVRMIAATNQPLERMVAAGDFREDLLYRLNAVTIALPPLRERRDDIPELIQYFLSRAKQEFHKQELEGISPAALELLQGYHWPGNVRQLRAVIRRCVLESVLPVISPDLLPPEIIAPPAIRGAQETGPPSQPAACADAVQSMAAEPCANEQDNGQQLPALVDQLLAAQSTDLYAAGIAYAERFLLMRVLRETGGNQSRAAEILGITRGKLRNRIATYDIKLESGVKIGE